MKNLNESRREIEEQIYALESKINKHKEQIIILRKEQDIYRKKLEVIEDNLSKIKLLDELAKKEG